MCRQARHNLQALAVVKRLRIIVGLDHVLAGWRPRLVSFLEVLASLDPQFGLLGVLVGSESCVPNGPYAKRAVGKRSSGFKNHDIHNGTIFQILSIESWIG